MSKKATELSRVELRDITRRVLCDVPQSAASNLIRDLLLSARPMRKEGTRELASLERSPQTRSAYIDAEIVKHRAALRQVLTMLEEPFRSFVSGVVEAVPEPKKLRNTQQVFSRTVIVSALHSVPVTPHGDVELPVSQCFDTGIGVSSDTVSTSSSYLTEAGSDLLSQFPSEGLDTSLAPYFCGAGIRSRLLSHALAPRKPVDPQPIPECLFTNGEDPRAMSERIAGHTNSLFGLSAPSALQSDAVMLQVSQTLDGLSHPSTVALRELLQRCGSFAEETGVHTTEDFRLLACDPDLPGLAQQASEIAELTYRASAALFQAWNPLCTFPNGSGSPFGAGDAIAIEYAVARLSLLNVGLRIGLGRTVPELPPFADEIVRLSIHSAADAALIAALVGRFPDLACAASQDDRLFDQLFLREKEEWLRRYSAKIQVLNDARRVLRNLHTRFADSAPARKAGDAVRKASLALLERLNHGADHFAELVVMANDAAPIDQADIVRPKSFHSAGSLPHLQTFVGIRSNGSATAKPTDVLNFGSFVPGRLPVATLSVERRDDSQRNTVHFGIGLDGRASHIPVQIVPLADILGESAHVSQFAQMLANGGVDELHRAANEYRNLGLDAKLGPSAAGAWRSYACVDHGRIETGFLLRRECAEAMLQPREYGSLSDDTSVLIASCPPELFPEDAVLAFSQHASFEKKPDHPAAHVPSTQRARRSIVTPEDQEKFDRIGHFIRLWQSGGWNEHDAIRLLSHASITVLAKTGRSKHRHMQGVDGRTRNFILNDDGTVDASNLLERIADIGDLGEMIKWIEACGGKRHL